MKFETIIIAFLQLILLRELRAGTTITSSSTTISSKNVETMKRYYSQMSSWQYPNLLKYNSVLDNEDTMNDISRVKICMETNTCQRITLPQYNIFCHIHDALAHTNEYVSKGFTYNKSKNVWEKSFIYTKESINTQQIETLIERIKQLNAMNYARLLKFVDVSNRARVKEILQRIIKLATRKLYSEIDVQLYNIFIHNFEILSNLDRLVRQGYIFDDRNQEMHKKGEKIETTITKPFFEILIKNVTFLNTINYKKLLMYLYDGSRPQVERELERIIEVVRENQQLEIDIGTYKWFSNIYEMLLSFRKLEEDGYKYNTKTKKWVKTIEITSKILTDDKIWTSLKKKLRELEDFNYQIYLKHLFKTNKDQSIKDLQRIIKLLKDGRASEFGLVDSYWFRMISEKLLMIKKIVDSGYTFDIKKKEWKIVAKIKIYIDKDAIINLQSKIKLLKEINYQSLFKYVLLSHELNIQNDFLKMIQLVKRKRFAEIDVTFYRWFCETLDIILTVNRLIKEKYIFNQNTKKWEKKDVIQNKVCLDRGKIMDLTVKMEMLIKIKYKMLIKYFIQIYGQKILKDLNDILSLIETRQYLKISIPMYNNFILYYKYLIVINEHVCRGDIILPGTTNWGQPGGAKPDVTLDETQIQDINIRIMRLITIKYKLLIKYFIQIYGQDRFNDFNTIIILIQRKRYPEITIDMYNKFVTYYDYILTIYGHVNRGDIYSEKERKWLPKTERDDIPPRRDDIPPKSNTCIDNNAIKNLLKMIKQLKKLNYEEMLKDIDDRKRKPAGTLILKVVTLCEHKKFSDISFPLYFEFKKLFDLFSSNNKNEIREFFITWNENQPSTEINDSNYIDSQTIPIIAKMIQQLEQLDYRKLLQNMDSSKRREVKNCFDKIITFYQGNEASKISVQLYYNFKTIYQFILTINENLQKGYKFNPNNNMWEKSEIINERCIDSQTIPIVSRMIQQLEQLNFQNLVRNVESSKRQEVINCFDRVRTFYQNNEAYKIPVTLYDNFKMVHDHILTINGNLQKGYKFNQGTNMWEKSEITNGDYIDEQTVASLSAMIQQLLKWDYRNLIKNVHQANREDVRQYLEKIMTMYQNNELSKISVQLYSNFQQIYQNILLINKYIKDGYKFDPIRNVWEKGETINTDYSNTQTDGQSVWKQSGGSSVVYQTEYSSN